jgi:transcriptional regulator with XRE-family HTH domain
MNYYNSISVGKAVSLRVNELLTKNNMTPYRLEIESGINHSTMSFIIKGSNKSASLTTVILLAEGFKMSLLEFLDSPYFQFDKLDID